jgi:tetratricopeptide (TPR) repeat protein
VAAGTPVIVLQNYGVGPFPVWHYAVVAGYDYPRGELMLRSGEKPRLVIPFGVFEYTWKDSGYWAMVAVPPERIPVTAGEAAYLAAIAAMERAGDAAAARTAYAAFLARWPGNPVAALGLANSQYALGELAAAESTLRSAADRDPGAVAVLNNLAHVVSESGRQDEALALIERARALGGPLGGTVDDTRTLILRRLAAGGEAAADHREGLKRR